MYRLINTLVFSGQSNFPAGPVLFVNLASSQSIHRTAPYFIKHSSAESNLQSKMGKFVTFAVALAVATAVLTVLFNNNLDVKYTVCFYAGLGYLDFLGGDFLDSLSKCMAETADGYLERDLKPGQGGVKAVAEFDCSKDFSVERLSEATDGFRRPAVCRGLLKNNQCANWGFDYFLTKTSDEKMKVQRIPIVEGNRRAYMRHTYPSDLLTANESFSQMKEGKQIYVSFDNFFLSDAGLVKELDLKQYFGDMHFSLHTLFVSNFTHPTLGSFFHAAPQDNFFFQCRGRKHWYYVAPQDLKYTSAYISKGVTFVSNYVNESKIVDRVTTWEAKLEEGDMMYNPPFWLHAVGTTSGETVAIANRVWVNAPRTQPFFDIAYVIGFPNFFGTVLVQKLWNKIFIGTSHTVNSIDLQINKDIYDTQLGGGSLPVWGDAQ